MKIKAITIAASLLLASTACSNTEADKSATTPQAAAEIPAADRVDNTHEVEAVARDARPTQAQIEQYHKDEAEMIDNPPKVVHDN